MFLRKIFAASLSGLLLLLGRGESFAAEFTLEIKPITAGPKHHFFGYIGHARTIPWNKSGRYIVALQSDFQERMPKPEDAADIILIDTHQNHSIRVLDQTRAWNFQQGTMLYWNPSAAESEFFFNDRDPKTNEIFAVRFDIAKGKNGGRVAEYRYPDASFGNGGVAQGGGWFAGINYGRLARLRPVTGYPGARDWTEKDKHPANDGVFKVNVESKEKNLLISFEKLATALKDTHPDVDKKDLFINHTLWSRDDSRLFFFVRADFSNSKERINVPFTLKADGTDLRPLTTFIGGHPEWASGHTLIGRVGKDQVLYDVERRELVGKLGTPEIFPNPEGDVPLSPDGKWFVNGHGDKGKNYYTVLRQSDGAWARSAGVDQGGYISGDLRIDPAPCWNRDSNAFLVGGIADDTTKTRQLFVVAVKQAKR